MEEQSWLDKNDDWMGPLMFGLGQGMSAFGSTQMSQPNVNSQSNQSITEAKGLPVAMNFPMWIPIVVVLGIVVYAFKKK